MLCDQEGETTQHLQTTCVFSRQFWHDIFAPIGLERVAPRRNELSFADWWRKASRRVDKVQRKGFNSAVVLGAWTIWLHRNKCVFDGASPSLMEAKHFFLDELDRWSLAGARKLQKLDLGHAIRLP